MDRQNQELLKNAVASYKNMKVFRDNTVKFTQELAGYRYGKNGSDARVPANFMEMAISIYTQKLTGGPVRSMATTPYKQLKRSAILTELHLNAIADKIGLTETLESCVQNGFLGQAMVKLGVTVTKNKMLHGLNIPTVRTFVENISSDDIVLDMNAKKYSQQMYIGDFYTVPETILKDTTMLPKRIRDKLVAKDYMQADDERLKAITFEPDTDKEFTKKIELLDLWIPHEHKLCTFHLSSRESADGVLVDVLDNWKGPAHGPYLNLSFGRVPDNIYPLPPASQWYDLHIIGNNLLRKLDNQAKKQKTNYAVKATAQKEGQMVLNLPDMSMFVSDDPKASTPIEFGGINQQTLAFFIFVKDLFNLMAGNPVGLAGLGPQTETVGQDQLLTSKANERINWMNKKVMTFTADIMYDLAWWLWHDPTSIFEIAYTIPNTDIQVPIQWLPEERNVSFLNKINLQLDPYSLEYQSPKEKLSTIVGLLERIVFPMMQVMQQQGISIEVDKLLKMVAELAHVPRLNEIIKYAQPMKQDGPVANKPLQSPNTNRTYTRVNKPGGTQEGKDRAFVNALMGAGQQSSEAVRMY